MGEEGVLGFKRDLPLYSLSVGEFEQFLTAVVHKTMNECGAGTKEKRFVYGLEGLSEILNCSISTARRIKKSGALNEAITQIVRRIIVDVDRALDLYRLSRINERKAV